MSKQWHMLTRCPALAEIVGPCPKMVAWTVQNLGDILEQSEFIWNSKDTWLSTYPRIKGSFSCGHCQICLFLKCMEVFNKGDGSCSYITSFINCSTMRVIYCLECPCGKLYDGKTK